MSSVGLLLLPPQGLFAGLRSLVLQFAAQLHRAQPESTAQPMDRAALNRRAEEILNTHGNQILRYAYSYLHNMDDAEEVLQDTLVQFLRTAPVFASPQHETAWLLRVAANLSKNRLAAAAVRKTDPLNEELVAEHREDLSFVWDAVKRLPAQYREVIHLFYYEGLSTEQIAQILNRKEATIRSHLHRGRQRLREMLKEDFDFA